jgi:inner membrane protein
MDNLTHGLTGALAAKIIDHSIKLPDELEEHKRKIFWLLVICANLPDFDVALDFFGDSIFSTQHHRGITHSLLFAPVLATLPAAVFYFLFKPKNFKALWLSSLTGILLHIFFDLITPFGTQIFAPLSTSRYTLDWMFIVDPFFTGILALTMLAQKIAVKRRKLFVIAGSALALLYLSVEMINHHLAYRRLREAISQQGITEARISALPQPLSIFRWKGLAQTDERVLLTFFSVPADADSLTFENHGNAQDAFVEKAMQTRAAKWYMAFARHVWIQSTQRGDLHVVEFRDLQFTIDKKILNALGFPERSTPFVLRFVYSSNGELMETAFDGKSISHKE